MIGVYTATFKSPSFEKPYHCFHVRAHSRGEAERKAIERACPWKRSDCPMCEADLELVCNNPPSTTA